MEHSKKQLYDDLRKLGITSGDSVLIHSSFKALGGIEDGAKGFFETILQLLGENGNLILPTFTYNPCYDTFEFSAEDTPSCVGYLTEYFRTKVNGAVRSLHPTHSCTVFGKDAEWFVKNHNLDSTPVGYNSPLQKLVRKNGKVLMIGDIYDHNTLLHGVEEVAMAPYVFNNSAEPVEYKVTDLSGNTFIQKVRRHNVSQSGYTQRYSRIIPLLSEAEISFGKVLEANCVLMKAQAVWEKGIDKIGDDPYYFVEKTI